MPIEEDDRRIELAGVRRTTGARLGEGLRGFWGAIKAAPRIIWSAIKGFASWIWTTLDRALATLGRGARVMIAIAATLFMTGFEWTNSARGTAVNFPAYPEEITRLGALGAILGFLLIYRMWAEADRADKARVASGKAQSMTDNAWQLAAVVSFLICMYFVFSGAAAESLKAGEATIESRDDRSTLRSKVSRLDLVIEAMPVPLGLDGHRELLAAYEAEAVGGWEMADLSPAGGCNADLDPRPRFLCNSAAALRDDIIKGEAMLAQIEAKRAELADLREQLATFKASSGAENFMALSAMTGGKVSWQFFSNWALVILSGFLLYINGKILDWLLEVWESRKENRAGG